MDQLYHEVVKQRDELLESLEEMVSSATHVPNAPLGVGVSVNKFKEALPKAKALISQVKAKKEELKNNERKEAEAMAENGCEGKNASDIS